MAASITPCFSTAALQVLSGIWLAGVSADYVIKVERATYVEGHHQSPAGGPIGSSSARGRSKSKIMQVRIVVLRLTEASCGMKVRMRVLVPTYITL